MASWWSFEAASASRHCGFQFLYPPLKPCDLLLQALPRGRIGAC